VDRSVDWNRMEISRHILSETDLHTFSTEASTAGWKPGFFPEQVVVKGLGNGQPFVQATVTQQQVVYLQQFGCIRIVVFND